MIRHLAALAGLVIIWAALFGTVAITWARETFIVEAATKGGIALVVGLIVCIPCLQWVADRK
jgi:hypothetical protein